MFFFLLLALTHAASQLEIHFFDVGQGDAQLIVFPSGYTILIDAGEKSSSSKNCKTIVERIKAITGKSHVDVAVLTHLHADHYGYTFKNGFWYLLESSGLTFGKFIDRTHGTIKSGITDCESVTDADINWKNVGSISTAGSKWVCYSTNKELSTKISQVLETAQHCSKTQINPSDSGAEVEITIVDAPGVKDNGKSLQGDHRSDSTPPSENDYSVCLRIQYGDFVYSTCGDLDGEVSDSYDYRYHDIETPYKDVMGSVDLYKANHHGSDHSNNANWMNALAPTVTVISCGTGNSYGHPREKAVSNMAAVSKKIYLTEDCNAEVTDKFSSTHIVGGEVIVKYTKGASTFTVTDQSGSFSHSYSVKTNKPSRKSCGVYSN